MSINITIYCDGGCGSYVNGGSGKDRKKAHVLRTEMKRHGWHVSGDAEGDYCPVCWRKMRCDAKRR